LGIGRISTAAQAVGIARACLEQSLKYTSERRTFGKRLNEHQVVQFKLADMTVETDAARMLVHKAAALHDSGKLSARQSAMAKVYAAEVATRAAIEAVQLHGGYGYTKEFKVERYFRDAKATELYEGTSESQRSLIAESVLQAG
jgi:alkylation response protein AidB-like acyl-CoA dehydrogenase